MKKLLLLLLFPVCLLAISFSSFSQDNLILKKRLAIADFVDGTEGQTKAAAVRTRGSSQSTVTTSNYSRTMATMLSTELVKSNAFIVVERQQLDAVFKEQDLGASGATTKESAAKLNQLLGVQLLVTGSITEWGNKLQNDQHSARGIFSKNNSKNTSRVTLDLRVIDASTGEIVMAETASGTAESKSSGVTVMGIGGTGAVADNSLMDSAVRKAVINCVDLIKKASAKVLWQGSIIKVNSDGTAVVKPGSGSGVKEGMAFAVYEKGEELKDPDTGLSLGSQLKLIGSLVITGEFGDGGKAATAKITGGKGMKTGDVIKPK